MINSAIGNEACWVCHDSISIGKLRLLDGTQLSLADSPPLCGQCHTKRYEAWNEGEHGVFSHAGYSRLWLLSKRNSTLIDSQ